jgi:hypothetical protein
MVAILPKFDLDRPTIEQEFVCKVEVLQAELGDDITIPATQHAYIISSWIKLWPDKVKGRWKLFNITTSNTTISEFLDNFTFWLMDARSKKVESENVGYIVSSGPFTSWLGPTKKRESTSIFLTGSNPHHQPGGNNEHKRKVHTPPSSESTPEIDPTSRCNVCNRLKYPDNKCPFYPWHPNADKDTKTAFADSAKGKDYIYGHAKKYRFLDTNDLTGETRLSNVPTNFKVPPASHKSSGSSGSSTKKGTHLVAFPINTPTFLNTITNSHLQLYNHPHSGGYDKNNRGKGH